MTLFGYFVSPSVKLVSVICALITIYIACARQQGWCEISFALMVVSTLLQPYLKIQFPVFRSMLILAKDYFRSGHATPVVCLQGFWMC